MCPRWFLSAVSFIGTLTSRLPSSAPCNQRAIRMAREQVLGDRDGLLGCGRPAKIHRPVDGGLSCPLEDYQREWEAFLDDFQQTLDKFAVPAKEQAELKAIVNSTRSDIVVNSALAVGSKS